MKLYECVPNFSEGKNEEVVATLRKAIESVPDVKLLDVEKDPDHNRSVFTFVGTSEGVLDAAFKAIKVAVELIDMNRHEGAHPRIGAADVVPFVPLFDATMEEAVNLAHKLAKRVSEELNLPVYLYGEAAQKPDRYDLANIRKGQYEGLAEKMKDPNWKPDYGPDTPHPTAGAVIIGARKLLVAYNVNLASRNLKAAKRIARHVRAKTGGLAFVKALGFDLPTKEMVQVSMNLTDYGKTPIHAAYEYVKLWAERYSQPVYESEIVGLVPMKALVDVAKFYLKLNDFKTDQIIESRIYDGWTLDLYLADLASSEAVPGGGAVSALSLAQASALLSMVAGIGLKRKKYRENWESFGKIRDRAKQILKRAKELVKEDSDAFAKVMEAYGLPKDSPERRIKIDEALEKAAKVPLETALLSKEVLRLADQIEPIAPKSAHSDVSVARYQAEAAFKGAIENVRINLSSMKDDTRKEKLKKELENLEQTEVT
ncbi:MAG: glutamate formimidoyltransferase [Thermotogae bacterium]|nr:glutamate formimidoyltransferase [Thermotogota bacterium]